MPVACYVGSFNIGTGAVASTVDVTAHLRGTLPDMSAAAAGSWCLLLQWNGRTESTTSSGSGHLQRGYGVSVSTSKNLSISIRDQDAAGSAVLDNIGTDDGCIVETLASAAGGRADVQSLLSNGFRFEILATFTTNLRVAFKLYTGLTNADCAWAQESTGVAPVTQNINNGGSFQPDFVAILHSGQTTTVPYQQANHGEFGIGVAVNATDQYVLMAGDTDGATSGDTSTYCRKGEICVSNTTSTPTASPRDRAQFVQFNSNGIRLSWVERTAQLRFIWIMLQGGTWNAGDFLTQTDTTTEIVEPLSSATIAPVGIAVVSASRDETAADAIPAIHHESSIGFAAGSDAQLCFEGYSRDGNTNMFTGGSVNYDAVYVNMDPTTDGVEGIARLRRVDNGSLAFLHSDADPSSVFAWWWAVSNPIPVGLIVAVNQARHRASYY